MEYRCKGWRLEPIQVPQAVVWADTCDRMVASRNKTTCFPSRRKDSFLVGPNDIGPLGLQLGCSLRLHKPRTNPPHSGFAGSSQAVRRRTGRPRLCSHEVKNPRLHRSSWNPEIRSNRIRCPMATPAEPRPPDLLLDP